ncbi:tetratricopeptide repeat protein, partial [Oceanospirillum sediminis]|nr:tetratricopeptide repeat protein [Oceanospirillum sediminis]
MNRSRYALENFPTSPVTADALASLGEAYLHLGMEDQARQTLELLKEQYPDHKQLTDDGELRLIKPVAETSKSPLQAVLPDLFS